MLTISVIIWCLFIEVVPSEKDGSQLPKTLQLETGKCWGYEEDCDWSRKVGEPDCDENARGWNGEIDPKKTFYNQADFGYLKEKLQTMKTFCKPKKNVKAASKLQCSENMEFCTASNVALDFRKLKDRVRSENLKYKMDIFSEGDIQLSGCHLDQEAVKSNLEFMSPLQSWSPELQHVKVNDDRSQKCDVILNKPVFIMKLDASVNMYHHFCDFFNLYLSLHLNYSLSGMDPNVWNTDKHILLLENIPTARKSPFSPSWFAFTKNPLIDLNEVAGKIVCVKEAVFPLLARMVFGLYYNTPLVDGCHGSEMVRRFSQFMMERLGIVQTGSLEDKRLRVTLISRVTQYRKILNEADLVEALEKTGLYKVTLARFNPRTPFTSQLGLTHNTDILIGIHGAGLTHLLFLPDWAQVLELFNCDDVNCYHDLARLRGVGYTTHHWDGGSLMKIHDVPGANQGPAHKKFSNYEFDPEEFVRVVNDIRVKVLNNPQFTHRFHDEL